jgi:hypothetical protein
MQLTTPSYPPKGREKNFLLDVLFHRRYCDNRQLGTKAENALLALIPHVQEVGIAGGGNIAVAFVNGAI